MANGTNGGTLRDYLETIGGTAGDIIGALNRPPSVVPPAPAPAAPNGIKWMPYAIAAGALMLILVIVLAMGGGRGR